MKTFIISFIFFVFFFSTEMRSQQRPFGHPVQHPSMSPVLKRISTDADTVLRYNHATVITDPDGEVMETVPEKRYYTRSDDLLTDTLHTGSSSIVYRYNEKNQLICLYTHLDTTTAARYGLAGTGAMIEDYEYDNEGRIVRKETSWGEPLTNPFEEPEKTFMAEQIWDYSSIRMTEKGYILENMECELDGQGRITYLKYYPEKDAIVDNPDWDEIEGRQWYYVGRKTSWISYVKGGNPLLPVDGVYYLYPGDPSIVELDGKQYRTGDVYYTYTDSSYTAFSCFKNTDGLVGWNKSTYVYNENGDETSHVMIVSDDGINSRTVQNSETVYQTYSGDGDVSNENLRKTNTVVYARSGTICISAENAATVQIFDLAGRTVKQQALSAGENRIGISTNGFYIVRVGNESFKVFVR